METCREPLGEIPEGIATGANDFEVKYFTGVRDDEIGEQKQPTLQVMAYGQQMNGKSDPMLCLPLHRLLFGFCDTPRWFATVRASFVDSLKISENKLLAHDKPL
eukprot:2903028-Amphidinium_carterae.1